MQSRAAQSCCILIPGYREAGRIGAVVSAARRHCRHVVVIDDGSPDATADEAAKAGATVLRHERNRGKGAALQTGFAYAREHRFDYVITLDADGQHDPDEIPQFVKAYVNTGLPVLVGDRMSNTAGMPLVRRWTNVVMSGLLSRKMGQYVPDTQNGYRLYRCDVLPLLPVDSAGFAAESEALLVLAEAGLKIGAVPVKTVYGNETSKIRPVRDALRFFAMLRRHERSVQQARPGAAAAGE